MIRGAKRPIHDDNGSVQHSLFDYVPDNLNEYEESGALKLAIKFPGGNSRQKLRMRRSGFKSWTKENTRIVTGETS